MKLLAEQAKAAGEVCDDPASASPWGEPGSGDGILDLRPARVTAHGKSSFIVAWEAWEAEKEAWVAVPTTDKLGSTQLKILRRSVEGGILPGLDDDDKVDQVDQAGQADQEVDSDSRVAEEPATVDESEGQSGVQDEVLPEVEVEVVD